MNYDTLTGYGITLKRLTEDKIELVRRWRNDPKISKFMEFRDYITAEMQLAWFQKINNDQNYYYIIVFEGEEIGLINIRDVDRINGTGEPGMFIWEDTYLNSDISFRAAFTFLDFVFNELKLKKVIIHVLSNNKRAIKFNKALGYRLSENQEGIYNQEYTLTSSIYEQFKNKIIKYLQV